MAPIIKKDRQHILRSATFCEKVVAIPTGSLFGNCSACVFRNIELYCEKLRPACSLLPYDENDPIYGTVYWDTVFGGDAYNMVGCHPSIWAKNFFEHTPVERIRKIAAKKVYDALVQEKQK